MDREMSGDLKGGMKTLVKMIRNPGKLLAEKIYSTMKGAGTKDDELIRIIVERSEIDLETIKHEFLRKYDQDLCEMIDNECSGDYKKLLLSLLGD